jgi:hypothetical protein
MHMGTPLTTFQRSTAAATLCRAALCCAVLCAAQVRRLHFHDFMLDVHKRLRNMSGEADPLKHVADDVAAGVKVSELSHTVCWPSHGLCRS